ncbi:hypothetical protein D3C73_1079940 [compost metagenome]
MPLGRCVIGADADQTVNARFRLQPAIGVGAGNQQGRRLDARLFAGFLFLELDLIAVRARPAAVHAQQHAGPVVRLRAAGARVDLQIGVITVGLAGQQGFQLGARGAVLDRLQLFTGFVESGFVALFVRHVGQHDPVFETLLHVLDGADLGFKTRAFAADGLGLFGIVPQRRILDPRVQLIELS